MESVRADLTDAAVVGELMRRWRPRWVLHCAALTDVDYCEDHPDEAERINVEMSRLLAEAAGQVGAGFAYISTDSVFDGKRGGYSEDDAPNPLNVYAATKLKGEEAVRSALPRALILRTNFYGWSLQHKQSLSEWVIERLEARDPFPGFQDVVFNPLLVNDLSSLVIEMMDRGLHGLYHLGCDRPCSKYEFAVALARVFGLDASIVVPGFLEARPMRATRPRSTWLRTDRVREALGRPVPGLEEGLRRLRHFRDTGTVRELRQLRGE
jgi:dTDP-4-dehydrorhamnose reductase